MNGPILDESSFANIDDPDFEEKIELVELLMFPLKSRHPLHFEKIDWTLLDIWKNVCRKHMIDHEYRYIYFDQNHSYDNQEPWEDELNEVNRAIKNTLTWIEIAKLEMDTLCSTLYSNIADRETYPKHYPRFKESIEKMQKRSKSSDKYYCRIYCWNTKHIIYATS
ncbi:MAG: hypothetical protein IPP27_02295 [Bacteroidetes bacterium]|nr:hypothetical protein [Bacteroidota bacterium]